MNAQRPKLAGGTLSQAAAGRIFPWQRVSDCAEIPLMQAIVAPVSRIAPAPPRDHVFCRLLGYEEAAEGAGGDCLFHLNRIQLGNRPAHPAAGIVDSRYQARRSRHPRARTRPKPPPVAEASVAKALAPVSSINGPELAGYCGLAARPTFTPRSESMRASEPLMPEPAPIDQARCDRETRP